MSALHSLLFKPLYITPFEWFVNGVLRDEQHSSQGTQMQPKAASQRRPGG